MMTISFIRSFFLVISGVVGYYIGLVLGDPVLGTMVGCLSGLVVIFIENQSRRVSVQGLSSVVFGLLLGVFMAKLVADILTLIPLGDFIHSVSRVVLTLIFSYLGAVMALRGKDEFNVIIPYVRFKRQDVREEIVVLDTSALIDGRISDIYKTRFLSDRMVVPRFVLLELQTLADSDDRIKKERGRRGLDLLNKMQEDPKVDVRIHEAADVPGKDVDEKIVRLAKMLGSRICTTDYSLGRVATLEGVDVLNIHELADAIKPVVFVGDQVKVDLIREGKEPRQAVGYLQDGTMIVVNDAEKLIGQTVSTTISSTIQTPSGRIIFAKLNK